MRKLNYSASCLEEVTKTHLGFAPHSKTLKLKRPNKREKS